MLGIRRVLVFRGASAHVMLTQLNLHPREAQMRISSLMSLVAAAVISGSGLAFAQQMEGLETFPSYDNRNIQDQYPNEPGAPENPSERQPGAEREGMSQGRSAAKGQRYHFGSHASPQNPAQGRSAAAAKKQPASEPAQ
jgi:hypothetical protein